jgi:hypothetical protein
LAAKINGKNVIYIIETELHLSIGVFHHHHNNVTLRVNCGLGAAAAARIAVKVPADKISTLSITTGELCARSCSM